MNQSKKKTLLTVIAVAVLFVAWFSWMLITTAKTDSIESKVKQGLDSGIQSVERDAKRVQVTYNGNGGYFVPNVNGDLQVTSALRSPSQEVYDVLLVSLNQDQSVPLIKVSNIGLDTDYTRFIDAHATVSFEVFPGIVKTMIVMESLPLPHFKYLTGDVTVR